MLARKGLVIVLLISLIAGYFYFRPYFRGQVEEPNITDRLPPGDFIGKILLLDLARETNSFLYYNKLPFRDFLTYEFLLAQGKSYGLDIQKPVYFFANESGEWGSVVPVKDSSKIMSGVVRLRQNMSVEDTIVGGQRVYKLPKENIYMTYGKTWLFMYRGDQLPKRMYHVIYSKKGEIHPMWKDFLQQKLADKQSLAFYSSSAKLKKYGVEKAIFTHRSDSIQFTVRSYFKAKGEFDFSLKEKGLALSHEGKFDKALTFHFNIDKIRENPEAPLKLWLADLSKRISFPVTEFFNAWEGDISFQEGGVQKIKETYIETEFDEEFNSVEVKKEKEVLVPGYAVILSMNEFQKEFVTKLFAKGIMRKEGNRFHILTSPPLKINQNTEYLMLHSSNHAPKILANGENRAYWEKDNIPYNFKVDSLNSKELFFSVNFPGMSLLRKSRALMNPW
ncbi:MAG: hypothetical protein K0R65_2798 [Crocinitomicaceae bacterium]|jgi:hypothetical protein|nr:hypothetical protein [Crocinitomicaceae bacterium]